MDWFSEKFIEDCVAEAPEAFIGRPLRLSSQQPRLGGFIPDLILVDSSDTNVIVEVQKDALDRYHLYKCLEYRDLLAAKENGRKPEVVLICETFPDRYKNIVATHNVITHVLSREQIVEKAIANCPRALRSHLLGSPSFCEPEDKWKAPIGKPRRYAWCKHDTLTDVYGFLSRELGRCGLWKKVQEVGNGADIIWTAKGILEGERLYEDLLDPVGWRIDNLIAQPTSWIPPHLENLTRIRKPRATFEVFETSKGNLSARWFPVGAEQWSRSPVHDWVKAPETEPYAYQRPANELVFIKNIRRLSTNPDHYIHLPDGDERATLNTMLLALVWSIFKHVQTTLSTTVDLEALSEFQLIAGEPANDDRVIERYDIVGWRIVSTHDLRIEEAKQRISSFAAETKVDVKTVLQTFEEQLKRNRHPKEDHLAQLAKALRMKGHKITVTPIRQLFSDLELASDQAYLACIASGD
jgi:hypothetical protein